MGLPEGFNITRMEHRAEVAHICYGSTSYKTIGGVSRGVVFLVNPIPDNSRPSSGGVCPFDYIVTINPLWLYGSHKGKRDLRGVNYRKVYNRFQSVIYAEHAKRALADSRAMPNPFATETLPAEAKVITSEELAFPNPVGREQMFSYLPDEAFDQDDLRCLKGTSIGYAIAAARWMKCSYVVLAGMDTLYQDGAVYSLLSRWAERNTPGWLRTFEPTGFAARYVNPEKQKRPTTIGV